MTFRPEVFLAKAIEAGRRALRDLEAEQRPAAMRRIAGYEGGTLPPPFARSLLDELQDNEPFRRKALDSWAGDRPPTDGPALASYLFLAQEEGWLSLVLGIAHRRGFSSAAGEDRSLQVERDALAVEVAALRDRLKQARKSETAARAELREVQNAARAPRRSERAVQERIAAEHEAEIVRRSEQAAALQAEVAALRQDLLERREAAQIEKRLRAEAETALRTATTGAMPATDPLSLAEQLDALAARAVAMAPTGNAESPMAPHRAAVQFDRTIPPDRMTAIDWLVSAGPWRVLIDGYNLGFALGPEEPGRARALAYDAAGRLAAVAPDLSIALIFDSNRDSGGSWDRTTGGIDVRFSPPERTADDEIVALAAADGPVLVVSNDRELRDRAEAVGAEALWSDALAEWSKRR